MPLYCEQAIGMIKALVVASPMDVSRFECWLEMLCLTLCRFLILAIADRRCCSSTHMHQQPRCCSQQGPFPPLLQPWSSCFLAGGAVAGRKWFQITSFSRKAKRFINLDVNAFHQATLSPAVDALSMHASNQSPTHGEAQR